MNVVQDQAVLDLSINNEQVLQRQLDATNDRFRVGEVTRTDVAQAESRLSAAHADSVQATGNLRAAAANYLTNVGHAPQSSDAARECDGTAGIDRGGARSGNCAESQYCQRAIFVTMRAPMAST